jgi:hypothetical protein
MMAGAAYVTAKYPSVAPYVVPVLVGTSGASPSPFDQATASSPLVGKP